MATPDHQPFVTPHVFLLPSTCCLPFIVTFLHYLHKLAVYQTASLSLLYTSAIVSRARWRSVVCSRCLPCPSTLPNGAVGMRINASSTSCIQSMLIDSSPVTRLNPSISSTCSPSERTSLNIVHASSTRSCILLFPSSAECCSCFIHIFQ